MTVSYPTIYPMFDPSSFRAGADDVVHRDIWLAPTYVPLPYGTVLGLITSTSAGTAGTMTAASTNVGNITCGTVTAQSGIELGAYTVTFVIGGSATAEFVVTNPEGATVGEGVVGTAFNAGGVQFTFTDGSTHAAVGDTWTATITGASVSDLYAPCAFQHPASQNSGTLSATADGSQVPACILAANVDVTNDVAGSVTGLFAPAAAPIQAPAYFHGSFAAEQLVIDPVAIAMGNPTTMDWQYVEQQLRLAGSQIYIKTLGMLG